MSQQTPSLLYYVYLYVCLYPYPYIILSPTMDQSQVYKTLITVRRLALTSRQWSERKTNKKGNEIKIGRRLTGTSLNKKETTHIEVS